MILSKNRDYLKIYVNENVRCAYPSSLCTSFLSEEGEVIMDLKWINIGTLCNGILIFQNDMILVLFAIAVTQRTVRGLLFMRIAQTIAW